MRVSSCCLSRFTEEPTEIDGKECAFVCATCHRECRLKDINTEDQSVQPRTEAQAYEDGMKDPLDGAEPPVEAPETPSNGIKIEDGLIYQDGHVVGKALSDRERYKAEYGEEWQGSDEALTKILAK